MQEEIDLKESQLREQQRRIDTLDESAVDYESTIGQFRELVLSLQGYVFLFASRLSQRSLTLSTL